MVSAKSDQFVSFSKRKPEMLLLTESWLAASC
jgi:hypothetical protein